MAITERVWRTERPITGDKFSEDMSHARRLRLPTYEWNGTDRDGARLTVVWVAGSETGVLLSAYQFTEG